MSGFGALRKTPPGQTGSWAGRAQFVPANRAIRFPDTLASYFSEQIKATEGSEFDISPRARRFFGSALSPRSFLEVGFEVQETMPNPTWIQIKSVVNALISMPVKVSHSGRRVPMGNFGSELAAYVRKNSTAGSFEGHAPSWLVVAGDLQCVVSLARDPVETRPLEMTELLPNPDNSPLYYGRHGSVDLWVVVEQDRLRRNTVRLHLSRLHSERAAFCAMLGGLVRSSEMAEPLLTLESKKFSNAMQSCIEYLDRKFSHGQDQAILLEALDWDLDVHGDEWNALAGLVEQLPDRTQRLVANYIDLRGSTGAQVGNSNVQNNKFESDEGN